MLTFSKSEVSQFRHSNKSKRWGQAFFDYFKLGKITNPQDKEFCDRLYNEINDTKAKAMVQGRTDATQ